MSTTVAVPRDIDYNTKLEKFRQAVETQELSCVQNGSTVHIQTGRKFDKVYIKTSAGDPMGRYMIDRNSWEIYGIKSWAQINPRRVYGTLDSVDEYDWSHYYGRPKTGTNAEAEYNKREADIQQNYKPRGRPRIS